MKLNNLILSVFSRRPSNFEYDELVVSKHVLEQHLILQIDFFSQKIIRF